MVNIVSIREFLEESDTYPVFDVRSPGEFKNGHIHGAINMPLFSNEERAIVGTIYKKKGKQEAIVKGLDFVGPKMSLFVKQALKHAINNTVCLHCWRGGMRSESIAWLLSRAGLEVKLLKDGYKAYRRYIRQAFNQPLKLIVLGGKTGSGKTHILNELESLGEQIIQLEYLANHKGSAFGALGQHEQPTTEQFENNLYYVFSKLNKEKTIWIEDESHLIGRVFIPDPVFNVIRNSPLFFLEVEKKQRIKLLAEEYAIYPSKLLIENIGKISKRLGPQNTKAAIEAISNNDYASAIDLVLTYYDKTYTYGMAKREERMVHMIESKNESFKAIAQKLIDYNKSLITKNS